MTDENMKPGDEAPPEEPAAAAENTCEHCAGRGTHDNGDTCPECRGTGVVQQAVGGG